MRRQGLALLVVSGILGVMASLAVAFVILARLERRASSQRVAGSKALLLARSGLEDASGRIANGQDPYAPGNAYRGEDWDGDGSVTGLEASAEAFQPGTPNLDDCPARCAMAPAYYRRHPTDLDAYGKAPKRILLDGRERGLSSGALDGSYAIRIGGVDGIHVNGGDLTSAGEHAGTYDTTLRRLLEALGGELAPTLTSADMTGLVTLRPAGGWRSLDDAAGVLGWSEAKKAAARPYLAFRAWVDLKVVRPNLDPAWTGSNGYSAETNLTKPPKLVTAAAFAELCAGQRDAVPALADGGPRKKDPPTFNDGIGMMWSGKRAFNPNTDSYAPDFERDSLGAIVGRAPVELNWARRHPPVMKALLRNLSGIYLDSGQRFAIVTGKPTVSAQSTDYGILGNLFLVNLSPADVDLIADALRTHAGFPTWATEFPDWDQTAGFDSWEEFDRFVELRLGGLSGLPGAAFDGIQAKKDLLKAAFNPNTDLCKLNPGEALARLLDKSDLTGYATELAFRNPFQRLTASGRISDAQGRILAERSVSTELSLEQVRLTSQAEFCAGDLGKPSVPGDESGFRKPGDAGFIQQTAGVDTCWGSRLVGGKGMSLQTYPEPQWPGACPPPAVWDGRLELATTETGAGPAATPGSTFLLSMDQSALPTYAAGDPSLYPDSAQGNPLDSVLGKGAVGPVAAFNNLRPDGYYSETRRAPGYRAMTNLGDGFRGGLSTWVKPSIVGGSLGRSNTWLTLCRANASPLAPFPLGVPSGAPTQYLGLGVLIVPLMGVPGWVGSTGTGFLFESRPANNDDGSTAGGAYVDTEWEANFWSLDNPRAYWYPHRWYLVTAQWNLPGVVTKAQQATLLVNATSHLETDRPWYNPLAEPDGIAENLTQDGFDHLNVFGPTLFHLGFRGITSNLTGSADSTLDELLALTFPTNGMNEAAAFSANRFAAGRYSKEDAGKDPSKPEYVSAPLSLPKGARIVRAEWTLLLPRPTNPQASFPELWPCSHRILYGTGTDLTAGTTAHAAVHLLSSAGAPLLQAPVTRTGTPLRVDLPTGVLKIGIDLRPGLGDNTGSWMIADAPVLESPALDDVTLTYTGPWGPRTTAWSQGD